jgi:hypothetical protein
MLGEDRPWRDKEISIADPSRNADSEFASLDSRLLSTQQNANEEETDEINTVVVIVGRFLIPSYVASAG